MKFAPAPQFFLRFYGPESRANADDCVAEMRSVFPQIVGTSESGLSSSVNAFHTATDIELTLMFRSLADRSAVHDDPRGKTIYLKFASKGMEGQGEFVARKPGDLGGAQELFRRGAAAGARLIPPGAANTVRRAFPGGPLTNGHADLSVWGVTPLARAVAADEMAVPNQPDRSVIQRPRGG